MLVVHNTGFTAASKHHQFPMFSFKGGMASVSPSGGGVASMSAVAKEAWPPSALMKEGFFLFFLFQL